MRPQLVVLSSRFTSVVGASVVVGLIVAASDRAIAAGVARDVVIAIGQHIVVWGSLLWRSRSTHMFNPMCTCCPRPRRKVPRSGYGGFPALKDNTTIRADCPDTIIY